VAEKLPRCGATRDSAPDKPCIRPAGHPPLHADADGDTWDDEPAATHEPLGYDVEAKQLTCGECEEPVTGVYTPIVPKPRPRKPSDPELSVDVQVDFEGMILQPCGHRYDMDAPGAGTVTHVRTEG
jgi:hypothetical protein